MRKVSMNATAADSHFESAPEARQPWAALALLCVAQFMVVLDITIVNVALPSIGRSLEFARADLQWVVTAYVVCSGGLLLIGGRAGDLFGRRRMFLAGLFLFTAASLADGLAPSAGFLIASRALQGVGAAMLTPSALSLVTTIYSGAQRAKALSIWGLIASAGIGVGVMAGGMLTTWLSWRWVFLVNVPVGLATAALTRGIVPVVPRITSVRPLDVRGALAVVSGLAVLVYALAGVPDHGWGAPRTLILLAISGALLATFAAVERSVRRPLLPPAVWRIPSLVSSATLILGLTGLIAGSFYLNSLYLQGVLGWSALDSGLAFLPFVLATGAGVHVAGGLMQRFGPRVVVVAGLALVAAAAAQLGLVPSHASYWLHLMPGFVVLGLGVGLAFPAVQITAMGDVDHERAGYASGLVMTAHEIGAALGVAVLSAIALGTGTVGAAGLSYSDGYAAAGVIAMLMAGLAGATVTSVRPPTDVAMPLH
jgi:EmrB/QacA subfamily drug resistance transporter